MADEELEFASKEDLELIKKTPELQRIYNAMQAGVTKKFQSFSEERRQLQESVKNLQDQYQSLDGDLLKWETWFTDNKPRIEAAFKEPTNDDEDNQQLRRGKGRQRENNEPAPDERYEKLVAALNQAYSQTQSDIKRMGKMLSFSLQLNDLYRQNPQMDGNKVLDIALKKGYDDLSRAYSDDEAYGKEIMDKKVNEALEPRLKEELAKRTTRVESGSGAVPISFEFPKEFDAKKGFTKLGEEFLAEREKELTNQPSQSATLPQGGSGQMGGGK